MTGCDDIGHHDQNILHSLYGNDDKIEDID